MFKKNIDGFIIAAGNQTRFNDKLPKALIEINGKTLLKRNIELMKEFVDNIYVVCSEENLFYLKVAKCYSKKVKIVPIKSGKGCGDAIYKALSFVDAFKTCIVIWGDSLQFNKEIYRKSIKEFKQDKNLEILVPVSLRYDPYVQILEKANNSIIGTRFSKHDIVDHPGYQDLSWFIFNAKKMQTTLYVYQQDNMMNEFSFLDIFNKVVINGKILPFQNVPKNSFNTKEELANILELI